MKIPKIISIIGGTGKMGTMFKEVFENDNIKVIITGRNTEISNIEATKLADIVIISVPISKTVETILEIVPYVKEGAMITDFTSVKVNPVKSMFDNVGVSVEVVGGHPLFGPSAGFKGQNFILCKQRVGDYYLWYKNFLESLGLKVIELTTEEHDKNMGVIQCLTHFSNLSLGYALQKLSVDLDLAKELSTPVYLMRLFGVGRILAQDADLYADIQMQNPYSKEMSEKYFEAVDELNKAVKNFDDKSFIDIFNKSKEYFGDVCDESMKVTDKLIKVMNEESK